MADNPQSQSQEGGQGERLVLNDRGHERADARMIATAIRKGWNIRPQLFDVLPDQMASLALDKQQAPRTRISAAGVLVRMSGQNLADFHKSMPDLHLHAVADADTIRANALARLTAYESGRTVSVDSTATAGNGHAGGLGGNGQPGDVAPSPSPGTDQHGSNGSHQGNGSASPDR